MTSQRSQRLTGSRILAVLVAVATAAFLVSAFGAAEAQAVITTPITNGLASVPPISAMPPAGETPPPAEAISDPIEPTASCGGWHLQSDYAGVWGTASTWWEYECLLVDPSQACPGGACSADKYPSTWTDHFYWDGSNAVFYGEYYLWSLYGKADPDSICEFWWDQPTAQWYARYSCNFLLPPNAAPTASFTFSCSGLSCSFDGSGSTDSDGTIEGYSWLFGDGTVESGSTPTAQHTYAQPGPRTVTLWVTDDRRAYDGDAKTFTLTLPNATPTADFTFRCVGLSCSFDGSGSSDGDGTIASYSWDFGDGTGVTGKTAQHRYTQSGGYTATLTVTDDGDATATVTHAVAVTNAAPTAAFTVSCSGLTCSFDGSRSADSDGTIESYRWDFGDGTSGAGKLAQHTYGQPRGYSVGLAVTDNDGVTVTESKTFNPISLSARGYKLNGVRKVELSWSGPTGTSVDIYRNGSKITTVQASTYTDSLNTKGPGSYTYEACTAASSICSNQATVRF
jgi:PKD repeat protein